MTSVEKVRSTAASIHTLDNGNIVLVSYVTPVAAIIDGQLYITNRKYSPTTSRHIGEFFLKRLNGVRNFTRRPEDGVAAIERDPEFFQRVLAGERG